VITLLCQKAVPETAKKEDTMNMSEDRKVQIKVGEKVLSARLYNNAAADDFLSLLPLSLTLEDYADIEKVSDLPKRLSTKNAPVGYKPSIGELTYYAPWGNLAIFYKGFGYSSGLVALGKIDTDIRLLKVPGPVRVIIEETR
jgi:hypothetical protein